MRLVCCLLAVGVLACAPRAAGPPPPSSPSRLLGEIAPSFRRPTLDGEAFDTTAVTRRVLVIDFFAAYCKPCQRALPALEALRRRRPDVAIVGVSLDDDEKTARGLVARHRLGFPVVHDPGHALAGRFRVNELPASFVIDRQGRIAWAAGPGQPEDALARAVAAAGGS